MFVSLQSFDALIGVDLQNDFMPGGSLAVVRGNEVVPVVNRLMLRFSTRILTRDWHPANHISFSSQPTFTDQSWPPHCVQNTPGANFHPELRAELADRIVSKGTDPLREAYSGFQGTNLAAWLAQRFIRRVFIAGLATDYCVAATARDALDAGFEVFIVREGVRGVDNPPGSEARTMAELQAKGIRIIAEAELTGTAS